MIEALKGSDSLDVLKSEGKNTKPRCKYSFGDDKWFEVIKEAVPGCKKAWRYSSPQCCKRPDDTPTEATERENKEENLEDECQEYWQQDLIAFYPALAKIQTECFMYRSFDSKRVRIDDEDMQLLEWVHENVRNKFEDFLPMSFSVPKRTSVRTASLCLQIADQLLFESGNVLFTRDEQADRVRNSVARTLAHLGQLDNLRKGAADPNTI